MSENTNVYDGMGEIIAVNAALLRLFKGEYRDSGKRHSDALFAKDNFEVACAEVDRLRTDLATALRNGNEHLANAQQFAAKCETLTTDLAAARAEAERAKALNTRLIRELADKTTPPTDELTGLSL